MNSKRLQALLKEIPLDSKVIDIGTDHAYLPILLYQRGTTTVLGTDIHANALEQAQKNIALYGLTNKIPLCLSDGLEKVSVTAYDTLVLAGMGYFTIEHILLQNKSALASIETILIESHNHQEKVRNLMLSLGYRLTNEQIILEKKKRYYILHYIRGEDHLTKEELLLGKYQAQYKPFYKEDYAYYNSIYQKTTNPQKRAEIQSILDALNTYLNHK